MFKFQFWWAQLLSKLQITVNGLRRSALICHSSFDKKWQQLHFLKTCFAFNMVISAAVGDDYPFQFYPESIKIRAAILFSHYFGLVFRCHCSSSIFWNFWEKLWSSAFMVPKETSKGKKVANTRMIMAPPPLVGKNFIIFCWCQFLLSVITANLFLRSSPSWRNFFGVLVCWGFCWLEQ